MKRLTAVCLIAVFIIHTPVYAYSILWATTSSSTSLIKDEQYIVDAEEPLLMTTLGVEEPEQEDASQPAEELEGGLEIIHEELESPELDSPDDKAPHPEFVIVEDEAPLSELIVVDEPELIIEDDPDTKEDDIEEEEHDLVQKP